jgi:hypothetical protein
MALDYNLKVTFADLYRQDLPDFSDLNYKFNISYAEQSGDNGGHPDRGHDRVIEFPTKSVEELHHLKPLSVQAAVNNRKKFSSPIGGLDKLEKRYQIDQDIINILSRALGAEGFDIEDFSCSPRHIKAFIIHDVRAMESIPHLVKYLNDNIALANKIGYEEVVSKTRYYDINQELKDNDERHIISNAAERIVHALWRNGYPLPPSILAAHGLNVDYPLESSSVGDATRRAAIHNWIDFLLPRLIEHVSFDRASNKSYLVPHVIGSLAQAALANGIYASSRAAGWHYADSELAGGKQLSNIISRIGTDRQNKMFRKINKEFINIAAELGFFQSGYTYAADTTWIDWYGTDDKEYVIRNPEKCNTGEGWLFASVTIMSKDARFTIGNDIIRDKSNVIASYKQFLADVGRDYPLNGICMDREFMSGDAIRMCRSICDEWIIRAKQLDTGAIPEKLDQTPPDESFGPKPIEFASLDTQPKLYIHPLDPSDGIEASSDHMLFLVARCFDEEDGLKIYNTYQNRWSIESYFRQLKHRFSPKTKSTKETERLFLIKSGSLFYNIHTLINRAPSPKYGLRLDVPHDMVLNGIVEWIFTRQDPFKP